MYVLKGGIQVDCELKQLVKLHQGQYDTIHSGANNDVDQAFFLKTQNMQTNTSGSGQEIGTENQGSTRQKDYEKTSPVKVTNFKELATVVESRHRAATINIKVPKKTNEPGTSQFRQNESQQRFGQIGLRNP